VHVAQVQADPHDWQQHSQVARDSAPQSQAGLQPHLDVILFFWKEREERLEERERVGK
jgi:hypothetical protein